MIRKTLTILSLIGLLLSVGLWGVSYLDMSYVCWTNVFGSEDGSIILTGGCFIYSVFRGYTVGESGDFYVGGFSGFATEWRPRLSPNIRVPLWIPTFLFGSLCCLCRPLHHRRRKRKKLGLCIHCGYDLRASKDRCPECGEEFVSTGVVR